MIAPDRWLLVPHVVLLFLLTYKIGLLYKLGSSYCVFACLQDFADSCIRVFEFLKCQQVIFFIFDGSKLFLDANNYYQCKVHKLSAKSNWLHLLSVQEDYIISNKKNIHDYPMIPWNIENFPFNNLEIWLARWIIPQNHSTSIVRLRNWIDLSCLIVKPNPGDCKVCFNIIKSL